MRPTSPMDPRFEARIEARDGEKRGALYLYDVIGWPYIEASRVVEKLDRLQAEGATALDIYINSPGGDVFDGMAIHAAVSRWQGEKVVIVDGLCASIASAIAMAGDRVVATVGAMFMVHNPWTIAWGEAADLRKTADMLDQIQGVLAGLYAKETGLEVDEVKRMMNSETWLTANEAVERGFADALADATEDRVPANLLRPAALHPGFEARMPPAARDLWRRHAIHNSIRTRKDSTMEETLQKISAQLGLATDADATEILAAVTRAVEHTVALASIHELLGLPIHAEPKRAELAILDLQRPGNAVPREQHDQVVGELAEARVELSVQRAIQAGVISATKADQEHWRKRSRIDLEDCERLITNGTRVIPMDEQRPRDQKTAKTNANGLTPIEEKVCKQLGLTSEQFKAAPMPPRPGRGGDEDED